MKNLVIKFYLFVFCIVLIAACDNQEQSDNLIYPLEDSPEKICNRRKKVQNTSWDSKAELVLKEISSKNYDF